MTSTLTIPLDLAERLDSPHSSVRNAALESLRALLEKSDDADKVNNRQMGLMQFVDKHAAPVVECQEPVAEVESSGIESFSCNRGQRFVDADSRFKVEFYDGDQGAHVSLPDHLAIVPRIDLPLYTSPPAPVAVVLPERREASYYADGNYSAADLAAIWNAAIMATASLNACLDKVKEMNR